jgi:putative transposase
MVWSSHLLADSQLSWFNAEGERNAKTISKSSANLRVHCGESKEIQRENDVRLLGVSTSGFYAWLKDPVSNRAEDNARLLRLIRASFAASHGIYGAPRVFLDLREAGETCSKHRVARLMHENNIRASPGYRTKTVSAGKPSAIIPNLLQRRFTVTRPNVAWVTDITYIRTWQGWLYLAAVMDLFSRKVIGWATSSTIDREVVLDAILMAVRARRPRQTIIHSDQGTQYGSDAWRRFCKSITWSRV